MEKNNITRIEKKLEERLLILETGRVAKKSGGAVLVQYEDTIVLVTVVISPTVQEDMGFAPLIVDYREKAYAVGKLLDYLKSEDLKRYQDLIKKLGLRR